MKLLVHPRHACQERRPHAADVPGDRVERFGEDHRDARQQIDEGNRTLEGMTQGQERQRHVVLGQLQNLRAGLEVRHDVGVRQHHAFGFARCSGRVDDRRQLVGLHGPSAIAELFSRAPLPRQAGVTALGDGIERDDRRAVGCGPPVHQHHRVQRRHLVAHLLDLLQLKARGNDRGLGARIVQDVACLAGGERWIDRNGGRAGREDREIRDQPLRAALGNDRHSIAVANTERAQPEREVANALEDVLAREPDDLVRPAASDELWIREPPRHVKGQVGDGFDVDLRICIGPRRGRCAHNANYRQHQTAGDGSRESWKIAKPKGIEVFAGFGVTSVARSSADLSQ